MVAVERTLVPLKPRQVGRSVASEEPGHVAFGRPQDARVLDDVSVLDSAGEVVAEQVTGVDAGRVDAAAQLCVYGAVNAGLGDRLARGDDRGIGARLDDAGGELPFDAARLGSRRQTGRTSSSFRTTAIATVSATAELASTASASSLALICRAKRSLTGSPARSYAVSSAR